MRGLRLLLFGRSLRFTSISVATSTTTKTNTTILAPLTAVRGTARTSSSPPASFGPIYTIPRPTTLSSATRGRIEARREIGLRTRSALTMAPAGISLANLQRISAETLSGMMLGEHPSLAVVDVRDSDHIGGHIKGSHHFPSNTLEATLPTLLRKLADKRTIIFHCALSQQRGPSAALRYLREKDRQEQKLQKQMQKNGGASGGETAAADKTNGEGQEDEGAGEDVQTVYVLDRGFVGWQEVYAENERLTEGYRKELWKEGYWG